MHLVDAAARPLPDSDGLRPFHSLTVDLLAWIDAQPRCYVETMEAWRTSCPRLPIWEEAVDAGLVQVERAPGVSMNECAVRLTARGRAALEGLR